MSHQWCLLRTIFCRSKAPRCEDFSKQMLREGAIAGADGIGGSTAFTHTDSTTQTHGTQCGSSWTSITRVTRREKRNIAAAHKHAHEDLGDSSSLPPFLTEKVNRAKSWLSGFQDEAEENGAERVVRSRFYRCFSSLLVIANAVKIGSAADQDVRAAIRDSEHGTSRRAELKQDMFAAAVCLEQLLRIAALRWKFFIGGDFHQARLALSNVASNVGVSSDDFLSKDAPDAPRDPRLHPCLHLGRLGACLHHVHLRSALSGATQHFADASPTESHFSVLATFFHSLPVTLLTLWMCVSGGINWWELQEVLLNLAPDYAVLFLSYQALMIQVQRRG